jgi:prefoldin alpha subunit
MAEKKQTPKVVVRTPKQQEYLESVMRMRQIEGQAANVQNNLAALERVLIETEVTLASLDAMKNQNAVKESLIPLGSGVFADGTLKKSDKILLDVGAGVVLEKSIDDAMAFMKERSENVRKNLTDFQNVLLNLEKSYSEAGQRAQQLQKEV